MKNNLSSRCSKHAMKSIIYAPKLKATVHTYGGTKFVFLGLGLVGRFLFLVISVFGFPLLLVSPSRRFFLLLLLLIRVLFLVPSDLPSLALSPKPRLDPFALANWCALLKMSSCLSSVNPFFSFIVIVDVSI